MARPLKIFLWIVGTLLMLIVAAAVALPLIIDPNDYKPQAAEAAKEATGRELTIDGDIELKIFPWLGARVSGVTLANAEGFGPEPFASVGEVDVSVRLLPLIFEKRIEAGTVTITGLTLNLAKAADGTNNWSDLAEPEEEPVEPEPPPSEPPVDIAFVVGGINIRDARLVYDDRQADSTYKLENLSIETGEVKIGSPLDLTLAFLVSSSKPDVAADVKLAMTAIAAPDSPVIEARDLMLDIDASGGGVPDGKQTVTLRGNLSFDKETGALSLPDLALKAMGFDVTAPNTTFNQQTGTLSLPGLVVKGAGVELSAAIDGQNLTGDAPTLKGKLSTNTFNARDVAGKFGATLPPMSDPKALTRVSLNATYSGTLSSAKLDPLTLKLDDSTATGHLHVTDFATQSIAFALKMDALDADRYMAPPAEGEKAEKDKEDGETEIPIAALDAVNAKGTAEIGTLTVKGVKMSNVKLTLDAPKGKIKTQNLTAQLYGGQIKQSAKITPGTKPAYDVKLGLDQVNAGPLVQSFLGKSYLSGAGNFNLGVVTSGTTVGDLLKGLNGTVTTSLVNGAVEGFNLDQTLATARALYKREPLPEKDPNAPRRTQFSDLKAAATIENGVLKTKALDAKGSWYTLAGDGNVNLAAQTIDYTLKPTLVGEKYKDLQGTPIPVRVTGNLFSPSVKVDLERALKDKAKEEVKEELKKQEDKLKEKLQDKMGDFFKKKE